MEKYLSLALVLSILFVSILYFLRTKNRLLKASIGIFGLTVLTPIINLIASENIVDPMIYLTFYYIAILIFIIHLFVSDIKTKDKILLGIIPLAIFIKSIIKILHLSGAEFIPIMYLVTIGLIIFLDINKLSQLREELRAIDLLGIYMLIEVIQYY